MKIWRITARKHIETVFSGMGGLYASGRWHPQGYKISYTSESLALASLEVFVHSSDNEKIQIFLTLELFESLIHLRQSVNDRRSL